MATDGDCLANEAVEGEASARSILTETHFDSLTGKIISLYKASIHRHARKPLKGSRVLQTKQPGDYKAQQDDFTQLVDKIMSLEGETEAGLKSILVKSAELRDLCGDDIRGTALRPLEQLGRYCDATESVYDGAQKFKKLGIDLEVEYASWIYLNSFHA